MHRAFCWLLAAFLALAAPTAFAADLAPLVRGLGAGNYAETEKAIAGLAETGDPAVVPVIEALQAGDLHVRKSDGAVVVAKRAGIWEKDLWDAAGEHGFDLEADDEAVASDEDATTVVASTPSTSDGATVTADVTSR